MDLYNDSLGIPKQAFPASFTTKDFASTVRQYTLLQPAIDNIRILLYPTKALLPWILTCQTSCTNIFTPCGKELRNLGSVGGAHQF